MESLYQCYRFVSQLVEIYANGNRSQLTIYAIPLAILWQGFIVDHIFIQSRSALQGLLISPLAPKAL